MFVKRLSRETELSIVEEMRLNKFYRTKLIAARHNVGPQTLSVIWRNRQAILAGKPWKYSA